MHLNTSFNINVNDLVDENNKSVSDDVDKAEYGI